MIDDHATAASERYVRSLAGGGLVLLVIAVLAVLAVMAVLALLDVLVFLAVLARAGGDDSVLDCNVRGHGGTSGVFSGTTSGVLSDYSRGVFSGLQPVQVDSYQLSVQSVQGPYQA